MSGVPEEYYKRARFHLYLELHGPEGIFKPLFEYLAELDAERVSPDYPIWHFRGHMDSRDEYLNRIGAALRSIPVRNDPAGLVEIMWRVLLMGPKRHNGFGRGFTPSQYEQLKKEGKL